MKKLYVTLTLLLCSNVVVFAQNGLSPDSYPNLALEFTSQNMNGNPSSFMPSVANGYGFGSYIDNPAAMALLDDSQFTFSLYNQNTQTENFYLGNDIEAERSATKLGDLGFVYRFPTQQGSFILGGGYNRTSSGNTAFRVSGRNNDNTITDSFLDPNSEYNELAFQTYAIDWGDVDSTYLESIFRIGFPPGTFPGIDQEAEIKYSTYMGEYSFFAATEFRKDLYVGFSASYFTGEYTYRRDFLEYDSQNDYDGTFIEGSDIDNILVHDEVDVDVNGGKYRAGLVYKLFSGLNIGASYMFPTTIRVSENYYSSIETSLDDGSEPFFYDVASDGAFRYRIEQPGQLKIGAALMDFAGFSISASAEYIDYQNTEIDFITDRDLRLSDEVEIRAQQENLNDFMEDTYESVTNFKIGVGKRLDDRTGIKAAYTYLPAISRLSPEDTKVYSAGFDIKVSDSFLVDVSGHYMQKDDRSELYNYIDFDDQAQSTTFETSKQDFRLQVGLKILF